MSEKMRADDDCTICAIAMATGEIYERVMSVAAEARGGYRYQGRPGTMSPRGVLLDMGYEAQAVQCHGLPLRAVQKLLWGRRAVLSLPSLNGFAGHHDVYWDGRRLRDPSPKETYGETFPDVLPLWAVVLDERAARAEARPAVDREAVARVVRLAMLDEPHHLKTAGERTKERARLAAAYADEILALLYPATSPGEGSSSANRAARIASDHAASETPRKSEEGCPDCGLDWCGVTCGRWPKGAADV